MRWRTSTDGLRWSSQDSLAYHAANSRSTGDEQYDCIVARLRTLQSPLVPIQLEGTGFFDRVGIFFAGVVLTAELLALQQLVTGHNPLLWVCSRGPVPTIRTSRLLAPRARAGAKSLQELKSKLHRPPVFTGYVGTGVSALRERAYSKGLSVRSPRALQPRFETADCATPLASVPNGDYPLFLLETQHFVLG